MTRFGQFGSTLTVVRGSQNLRTGAWVETSRHDITGCAVDRSQTFEVTGLQDSTVIDATAYAPPGVDVTATDRVLISGDQFDVVGVPVDWVNPDTGDHPGTVIKLIYHKG